MPVSRTPRTALSPSRRTVNQMRPFASVYLVALVSRLPTTWVSRTGSASSDKDSGGRLDCQLVSLRVNERLDGFDRTGNYRGQFQPLLAEFDFAPHDTGHVEQVVHQPDQLVDLPLHHVP